MVVEPLGLYERTSQLGSALTWSDVSGLNSVFSSKARIPLGKSDASGGIGPKNLMLK